MLLNTCLAILKLHPNMHSLMTPFVCTQNSEAKRSKFSPIRIMNVAVDSVVTHHTGLSFAINAYDEPLSYSVEAQLKSAPWETELPSLGERGHGIFSITRPACRYRVGAVAVLS